MKQRAKKVAKANLLNMWWFPLIVLSVVLVGTPLVVVPKINGILDAHRNLSGLEQELQKAEVKIGQLDAVDEAEMLALHTNLKQALPTHIPYYEVLLLLQQLGVQTGVALGDFELNPGSIATDSADARTSSDGGYVTLDTELRVTGTVEQVSEFVVALYDSIPLVVANEISISKAGGTEVDMRSVGLKLQMLYMPEKPVGQTVSLEPLPPLSGAVDEVSQALSRFYNPEDAVIDPVIMNDAERVDLFNF